MDEILNQIQEALNHKLYLIALQCCLTLPDICSALQSDNGKTDSKKYKKWYKDFCKSSTYLDAKDCYLDAQWYIKVKPFPLLNLINMLIMIEYFFFTPILTLCCITIL